VRVVGVVVVVCCLATFTFSDSRLDYAAFLLHQEELSQHRRNGRVLAGERASLSPSRLIAFTRIANRPQWLLGPFLEGITQKAWYNGRPYGPLELGYIRNGLRIVGAIRLRQLRVSPDSCVLSGTNSKVIKVRALLLFVLDRSRSL
jgi:hypothetical protein